MTHGMTVGLRGRCGRNCFLLGDDIRRKGCCAVPAGRFAAAAQPAATGVSGDAAKVVAEATGDGPGPSRSNRSPADSSGVDGARACRAALRCRSPATARSSPAAPGCSGPSGRGPRQQLSVARAGPTTSTGWRHRSRRCARGPGFPGGRRPPRPPGRWWCRAGRWRRAATTNGSPAQISTPPSATRIRTVQDEATPSRVIGDRARPSRRSPARHRVRRRSSNVDVVTAEQQRRGRHQPDPGAVRRRPAAPAG